MELGKIIDTIWSYDEVTTKYGFVWTRTGGIRPWSHRHSRANGWSVDTRGSDWAIYNEKDELIQEGKTPYELSWYLSAYTVL